MVSLNVERRETWTRSSFNRFDASTDVNAETTSWSSVFVLLPRSLVLRPPMPLPVLPRESAR